MHEFMEIESKGGFGFIAVRFFPWGARHYFDRSVATFLDDSRTRASPSACQAAIGVRDVLFAAERDEVVAYNVEDGQTVWRSPVEGKAYGLAASSSETPKQETDRLRSGPS